MAVGRLPPCHKHSLAELRTYYDKSVGPTYSTLCFVATMNSCYYHTLSLSGLGAAPRSFTLEFDVLANKTKFSRTHRDRGGAARHPGNTSFLPSITGLTVVGS